MEGVIMDEIETRELSPNPRIPVKYRDWVHLLYSKIDIEKLDIKAAAFLVPLPEIYIPIETAYLTLDPENNRPGNERYLKRRTAGLGEEWKQKGYPSIDIEELAGQEKCILLRGAAGMGKTTLVKHLAYTVIEEQKPVLLRDYLPVVVFLKNIWPIYKEEITSKKTANIPFISLLQKYFKENLSGTLNLEDVESFLSRDRALFLLDGLDEVPEHLRRRLVDRIAEFRAVHINNHFILTGRPHGIDAGVITHFGEFLHDIESLDEKKTSEFISKWLKAVSRQNDDFARVNAANMITDIRSHRHANVFTRNPLLLTVLCIFYLESGKRIPDQRAELYDRIIGNFLYRRFDDPLEPEKSPRIEDYLNHLAFLMQVQHLTKIDVGKAKELLKEHFPCKEESVLPYHRQIDNLFAEIEPRCGFLKRPGEGELEFLHLTFQEFTAASHMLHNDIDYKQYVKIDWWHETILLYAVLISRDYKEKANLIVNELLNHSHKDTYWPRRLWLLAAKILRDMKEKKRNAEVTELARKKLVSIIESDASLEERLEAGEILGLLEDPRIESTPMIVVESGEFTRGADKYKWEKPIRLIYLDEFRIGKYPVTNAEFGAFICDSGYDNKDFWTPEGWQWKEAKKISEPMFWNEGKWNGPNFPVVGVSWYEACAYAKWLSKKEGRFYTLPTEAQWEKTARGSHGSLYPWGKEFDKNLCNTSEGRMKRTSPVGIFPKGKSPYGCLDMSGNVWEWCLDWYHDYYYKESPGKNPQGPLESSKKEPSRVLRGGSWSNDEGGRRRCSGVFRDYDEPGDRLNCVGFRLVSPERKETDPKKNKPIKDTVSVPKEVTKEELERRPVRQAPFIESQEHMDGVKTILILSANPKATARLRLDEEVREIENGLRLAKHRDQFDIRSRWAVRLKDLRRSLLDYEPRIVHFTGHGREDGLLVEDNIGIAVRISSKALAGLFKLFSTKVKCVILSACYSESQADAISEHINYVIGMRGEIKDKAAIEFAVGFYDALGAGRSVEEAFEFGRNAILQIFPDLPEHLIPILKKKKF